MQPTPDTPPSLEIVALDQGPGFTDFKLCLRDGYSTVGTAGNGLGAIVRNSSFLDYFSAPTLGTVLLARFSPSGQNHHAAPVAGLQTPKPGEDICGDAWATLRHDGYRTVIVADGLGHGPDANIAARTAIEFLYANASAGPKDLLEIVHAGIRHTRGAAVGIARLDEERRTIAYAGLGNIVGRVCESDSPSHHLVSMNGTAGMESRASFREFQYAWPPSSALIMHSDGLTGRWEIKRYAGLLRRDPGIISGILLRDFSRGTDDATVVTVK